VSQEIHSTQAQAIQIELARTRTLLALDRTLLAWVRTSLSLIAFGFTLAKFVHELIGNGTLHGMDAHYPRHLGITLMLLGIAGLLAGAFDYWHAVKRLKSSVDMPVWSTSLILSLFIAAIGMFLMVSLLSDLKLN
jgi:putative membrane protein